MRRLATAALLVLAPAVLFAQKQCKKGIPCGGTCIAAGKTCHVGEASPAPTQSPKPTQAAKTATADTASRDSVWVASSRGRLYYRTGCTTANELAQQYRIFFKSEDSAKAAGYTRSKQPGC